jgi:hypothetical protein
MDIARADLKRSKYRRANSKQPEPEVLRIARKVEVEIVRATALFGIKIGFDGPNDKFP